MKVLSHQEYEFLKNPDKFNRNYQYVLTHRIKRKLIDMQFTMDFIDAHIRPLLTDNKKKKHDLEIAKQKWHSIVSDAMNKISEDKEKKYEPYYKQWLEKDRDAWSIKDNHKSQIEINNTLWEYQRNIVKLYLGEEFLQHEAH